MTQRSLARAFTLLATAALLAGACAGPAGTPSASVSAAPASAAPTSAATASAAPILTRPVEFVITTGPGGGSDIYARLWTGIMTTGKFVNQPVVPVNKPGGSGAIAFQYTISKIGDPHYLMVTLNSFFTTILVQNLPFQSSDFTPLAVLAKDPFFLWVNADSTWKTAQDFIDAAKAKSITVAGTGSKQEDEVMFRRIEKLAGTKPFNYIPYDEGSTVAASLAGHAGGTEVTVNNPSEGLALWQASPPKVRPICAFLPDPPTGTFQGVPTCKSQGLDITDYFNLRSVVGPPGLNDAQIAYWGEVFKKVNDAKEWKDFVAKNQLVADFRTGADAKKLFDEYTKLHTDIAIQNGWYNP